MNARQLDQLAQNVARSFALTLKGVPKLQRESISLTYLLARLADTLSDCGRWSAPERLLHLERLESALANQKPDQWKLDQNVGSFKEAEAHLVLEAENLLKSFCELSEYDRLAGQEVLKILISAMRWDLKTFEGVEAPKFAVKDIAMFDWYCYSIAGCVGAYWVKIFKLDSNLEPLAVAYGKGLQRINILRDIVADYKIHRVYLPVSELQKFSISTASPFWTQPGWVNFVDYYLNDTRKLLLFGAHFCDTLSYTQFRLRLSSVLPLAIGWPTLDHIEKARQWDPPIKVSRDEVKKLVMSSFFEVLFKRSFTKKYQEGMRR